jgi:DNA ligase-1
VQKGYDLTNDFAEVFSIIKEDGVTGLENIKIKQGKPINVMLFQKAKNIADAFETVGKPAALEFKIDGFRIQIHSFKGKITLYTRRLENVTKQFPDVVAIIKKSIKEENFIIDTEVVGLNPKTKKFMPFQDISQRIKRKYDIEKMALAVPIMINVFDIMSFQSESLLEAPFHRRRHIIEKIVKTIPEKIQPIKQIVTEDIQEAEKFYKESLDLGNEGIMAKNLSAPYKPGSRVGYGIKIKPILEELDLVITKAEFGEGKRVGWFTSFTVACFDKINNKLVEVGKVSTGIKEKKQEEGVTYSELTELLNPLIEKQSSDEIIIKPQIILEIAYEEVQASSEYSSGFALRFPRCLRIRLDKPINEIATLEDIKNIYNIQRSRNN